MIDRTIWLAFDIGTTGTKAALLTEAGMVFASAYHAYSTHSGEGGVMEQNAADWWQATKATARELIPQIEAGSRVRIAITGQMQDTILVDQNGDPLRPVLLYSDTRSRAEADEVNAAFEAGRLRGWTGNESDAGSLPAKLLWLKRHEPRALTVSGARLLFGAADFIASKLTGTAATDTTTASTTGLMVIHERQWLKSAVFERIGLSEIARLLPALYPGGAQVGKMMPDVAAELGLPPDTPVHLGPGDAGAVTIGAGAGEPGHVSGYLGTSGWIAFSAPETAQALGVFTLAHPQMGWFIPVAPLLTAGGNLEWVRDLFGRDDYPSLIAEAMNTEPSPLLYLPYLNGERTPFYDPLARGAFIGLRAGSDRAALYRAVLEGVIIAYRHAMEALVQTPVSGITLTGGGTQSLAWSQLFADILGVRVDVAAEAEFAGIKGAVLAAQVANGELTTYTPADRFAVRERLTPDNRHQAHYERQYRLFRASYPALQGIFAGMSGID